MERVMAIMLSSEQKPPLMLPSGDETHTIIWDFSEVTESNFIDDLSLVQVTNMRFDGRKPDIPHVEIWRMV